MRTNVILTLSVAATAALFSACGAPAANNTNAVKPANAAPATATTASPVAPATKADAPAADGQVIKIEEAGIQITVPKGFKFSKDGEDTIVMSEDEGVDVRFSVPKDGDYEKLMADAGAEIDNYLKNVKMDSKEGQKRDVNGMEAISLTGTATNDGADVVWNLTVIKSPKKPVLANIYADKSSLEKYAAQTKALLDSVKKL
ncbi:MAG: hypothetical protein IPG67_02425 [Acidobacteria bacterium]|nr:hypothetical protein [Acidobacteriota bacterium]MBK7933892.1 hypothetical protein [Acidobacteriota bacterium]